MKQADLNDLLDQDIGGLQFSKRAKNCLNYKLLTWKPHAKLRDVVKLAPENILNIKNVGQATLENIQKVLGEIGLRLGMTVVDLQRLTRDELIGNGRKIIKERHETADIMRLSSDWKNGLSEGIAEYIATLLQESATDLLEELSKD